MIKATGSRMACWLQTTKIHLVFMNVSALKLHIPECLILSNSSGFFLGSNKSPVKISSTKDRDIRRVRTPGPRPPEWDFFLTFSEHLNGKSVFFAILRPQTTFFRPMYWMQRGGAFQDIDCVSSGYFNEVFFRRESEYVLGINSHKCYFWLQNISS